MLLSAITKLLKRYTTLMIIFMKPQKDCWICTPRNTL